MAIFFVNQKNTYKQERAGSYLWSPKFNKNGTNNSSYKLMKEVKKGDLIIHNAGGKITAISRVEEDCKSENKPNSLNDEENRWENDGWKVNTEYYDLSSPLPISDLNFDKLSSNLPTVPAFLMYSFPSVSFAYTKSFILRFSREKHFISSSV